MAIAESWFNGPAVSGLVEADESTVGMNKSVVGYMQTTLATRLFGALAMHRGASAALRRFVIQA
jgi:hypothetical protein